MYGQYLKLISLFSSETIDYSSSDRISRFLFFPFSYCFPNSHAYSEIPHTFFRTLYSRFDNSEIRSKYDRYKQRCTTNNNYMYDHDCI